jgi:hypothetical protein
MHFELQLFKLRRQLISQLWRSRKILPYTLIVRSIWIKRNEPSRKVRVRPRYHARECPCCFITAELLLLTLILIPILCIRPTYTVGFVNIIYCNSKRTAFCTSNCIILLEMWHPFFFVLFISLSSLEDCRLRLLSYGMTPCTLVDRYQRFGGTCCPNFQSTLLFYPGHGCSRFLRNIGTYLPNNKASHPRRR